MAFNFPWVLQEIQNRVLFIWNVLEGRGAINEEIWLIKYSIAMCEWRGQSSPRHVGNWDQDLMER